MTNQAKQLSPQMKQLSEQIQEDIVTFLDGMDDQILDTLCRIVVSNISKADQGQVS